MKSLAEQVPNAATPEATADERARQDFAFTLRNYVTGELMPSVHEHYAGKIEPQFKRRHGRAPQSHQEIRAAVTEDSWFRFYASARRTSQELIWNGITDQIERQWEELNARAAAAPDVGGTLTLNPDVKPAPYATTLDIHCMPGGYAADYGDGDVSQGALYDRGVYLYLSGLGGPRNDGIGVILAHFVAKTWPDFKPSKILEMGCAVGHGTLPMCDVYPDADITAIDIGASLLRYAHTRARSWGKKVHWVQANAEATGYPDASFDLVFSTILLHETSTKALPAIFAECRRLLKPGGLMIHIDQPSFKRANPFQRFMQENETWYNNEPFWRTFRSTDLPGAAINAGFAPDKVSSHMATADIIKQAQNNEKLDPDSPEAQARGFEIVAAWR